MREVQEGRCGRCREGGVGGEERQVWEVQSGGGGVQGGVQCGIGEAQKWVQGCGEGYEKLKKEWRVVIGIYRNSQRRKRVERGAEKLK